MIDLKELIENSKKLNDWGLGNELLYNLCKDHPNHKEPNEIIAKIWLIGRAYSASIERRKPDPEKVEEHFWEQNVVPEIMNSKIDVWINNCKNSDDINVFMETHKNLIDLFEKISGLYKRSLASKYLHFHLRNKFYIYDSIASRSIRFILKELKEKLNIGKNEIKTDDKWDHEYSKFYQNCDYLKNKIIEVYKIDLSCRELDNLLTREITQAIANKQ
jgi:hypothetical protein